MEKKELKKIWDKYKLSCRKSYKPEYIKKFCKEISIEFQEKWIYTKDRYRELSNRTPRVDAEDLLLHVCEQFKIKPNKKRMETSRKMLGEGSRRECLEEAYLE